MLTTFIVDDSVLMRERLAAMLSDFPEVKIVGQARDGLTAIKLIFKQKPDLVILDIQIPKISGIDVLDNIKKHKLASMVIILTNFPYPQYRKKCLELGADYFFNKSTEFDKVVEVCEKMIQASQN